MRAALKHDGEVIDCDKAMPFRLFQHAWKGLQEQKAQKFRAEISALIMKLSDILSADFGHSKEGMSAERLQAAIGSAHQGAFDFDAMSRLLTAATVNVPMAESRRQRIRGLLATLRTQRFFPPATESDKWIGVAEPYSFMFDNCAEAVAAYRERLPKMTELAKAMAMAKLETVGEYSEARHDAFFAGFGDNGLDAEDIAVFPDYLICLRATDFRAAETDLILRAFVAGMPVKLVVQTDDLLEQSPIRDDYLVAGLRGKQVASSAIGLGASFVLQASGANLFQLREPIMRGLAFRGPGAVQHLFRRQRRHPAGLPRRPRPPPNHGRSRHSPTIRRRAPTGRRASRSPPTVRSMSIGRCSGSTMRTPSSSWSRKPWPSRWSILPPAIRAAANILPRCRAPNGPPTWCRSPNS